MSTRRSLLQFLSGIIILTMLASGVPLPSASAQGNSGDIKRQVNAQTGKVNFIGPESGRLLSASKALGIGAAIRPEDPGMALAKRFSAEFGLKSPERDLKEMKINHGVDGRLTAHYQQHYQGIPVMGGELIVNTNDNGDLYSMNGEVSPDLSLSTQPAIDSEQARETALQGVAKWYQKIAEDFLVSEPELWIFDESLLSPSTRPAELVWRMEVTPKDISMPVRELVLVNAQRGSISLHFNQVDTAWKGSARSENISSLASPTCTLEVPNAGTQFFSYVSYNCVSEGYYGAGGGGIGAGDFNNDGRQDVAMAGATDEAAHQSLLLIFLQTNNGTLAQPVAYPAGAYSYSGYLAVGDLNNDGRYDVVTLNSSDGTIGVFLQNSNGTLNNRATYAISTAGNAITVGDINHDNLDDVVVSHYSSISVFTQNATGTLNTMVSYPSPNNAFEDIAIGDVNNDGLNDVVKMYGGSTLETLAVYTQNNSHTLNPYYSIPCTLDCGGRGIEIGDVTGDGRADVVMSVIAGYGSSAKIAVFPQNGSGNLQSPITYPASGDNPSSVEIADIDLDNKLDVIVLHDGWQTGTFSQKNDGSLGPESLYPSVSKGRFLPQDVSVGDVNHDGLPDILIAGPIGLEILYRTPIPTGGGHRLTYTANQGTNLPGQLRCNETKPFCTNGIDLQADAAHVYAGGTWNLYHDQHARDSLDNHGMTIKSTVHYDSNYDNSFWDGDQIIYGDASGWPLADDVVAHEYTHGVTQYESNLFYYYQSGAINESFSDLWGEYYDQTNGLGTDTAEAKWLISEDILPSGAGAIRSMSDPTVFGDPDKMSSPKYYFGDGDYGGVHHNSGINNKAVFLMVDGGTFGANNQTISALGWTKTSAIYYEVNTKLLTSGADYSDLYYALQQACSNLIGQKGITSADCAEVKDALDAVEMNGQPVPNFNTDTPLCAAGHAPNISFADDLEAGTGKWIFDNGAYPRWQWDSPYESYAQSGLHFLYADDYPDVVTDATARLIPLAIPSNAYLRFAQAYDFETGYNTGDPTLYNFDGGVLEYSLNNGATWVDAGSLIEYNGYKGKLFTGARNPLSGRSAFVGTSHGYITTRLNLASLAGKTVSFRWRMGLDEAGLSLGWWVDNIKLYTCIPLPTAFNKTSPVNSATGVGLSTTLSWTASTYATSYQYCYDLIDDNQCNRTWSATNATSASIANLGANTNYYWQVRAVNVVGTTYADNQTWNSFTTTSTLPPGTARIETWAGTTVQGKYSLGQGQSLRDSYPSLNNGPVKIMSTNSLPLIGAERVIYKVKGDQTSFTEMMGLPDSQLTTTYWLPWYNNVDLDTQLRFGNVSGNPATVHVYIGTDEMTGSPFTLQPGESTRQSFAGINNGPVKIQSDQNIVAAERVIYKVNGIQTSFSEMMGLPDSQLTTTYWLPWYNNVDLDTQLRFGNVSSSTAQVHVYIGTDEMTGSPFTLQPGESTRQSFAGINNGPVKIESDHGVPIVAAERVIYKVNGTNTSFIETMGLPDSQLTTTYWLPWYNNVDLDTQLRFGNVSSNLATVHVYIGGAEVVGSPFTLQPGESTRQSFSGINNGPVKIESDANIVAAERVIYKAAGKLNTSFSEMMALPNSQLNATYWLPWYNNVDLDTQLRFGVP